LLSWGNHDLEIYILEFVGASLDSIHDGDVILLTDSRAQRFSLGTKGKEIEKKEKEGIS